MAYEMGALALAAAIGGGSGILGGILGASAAQRAAGEQAQSADYAANLQSQATQQALALEAQEYGIGQSEMAPYLNAGYGALGALESGMGLPGTTPNLQGVNAGVPATLAPQNQPAGPNQAQTTLSSLGLSPGMAAPNLSLGVNNNSQATFQQAFESAGDDIGRAVASGLITKDQGIAAMGKLQNQLNMYGGGGLYGKAGPTLSQAQGELATNLQQIQSGHFTYKPPSGVKGLSDVYIPSSAQGWESGSPGTGASLANYAIEQGVGGNQPLIAGTGQPTTLSSLANPPALTSTAVPGTSDLRRVSLTPGGAPASTAPAAPQASPATQPALNTNGALNATSLNEQFATPFQAPTAEQAAQTPGEQFALQQGQQAIQRSAAAQGNLLTGGTLKDLNDYTQNQASTYYQQAYNNALQQYQQAYNIFNNNQTGQYNKLASMSGMGQTTAAQLSNQGNQYAGTAAQTGMSGAGAVGNQLNNAAAATASGYVGSANALGGAIQGAGMLPLAALAMQKSGQSTAGLPSASALMMQNPYGSFNY